MGGEVGNTNYWVLHRLMVFRSNCKWKVTFKNYKKNKNKNYIKIFLIKKSKLIISNLLIM